MMMMMNNDDTIDGENVDIDDSSQNMALCEVLGLTSLATVTMDDDDEDDDEHSVGQQQQSPQNNNGNCCYHKEEYQWRQRRQRQGQKKNKKKDPPSSTLSPSTSRPRPRPPRRIQLPNSKSVSRHGHRPDECFAWLLPDVFSKEECQQLIDTVEGRRTIDSRRQSSSSSSGDDDFDGTGTSSEKTNTKIPFTYVSTASAATTTSSSSNDVHAAATHYNNHHDSNSNSNNHGNQNNNNVHISQPNPHKLAVFHHPAWVDLIWERISSKLLLPTTTTTKVYGDDNRSSVSEQTGGDLLLVDDGPSDDIDDETSQYQNENEMLRQDFQKWLLSGGFDRQTAGHADLPTSQRPKEEEIEHEQERKSRPFFLPKPVGINPRLRVLKYDAVDGDEFQPHFDKTTTMNLPLIKSKSKDIVVDSNQHHNYQQQQGSLHEVQTSAVTVLLYLNDGGRVDFGGGETVFLSNTIENQTRRAFGRNRSKNNDGDAAIVRPSAGTVVLFEHDLYHCGNPLEWGTKYVLRTDIMFPMSQEELLDAHERKSLRQKRRNRNNVGDGRADNNLTDRDENEEPNILTVQDLVHHLTSDDQWNVHNDGGVSNVLSMPTTVFKDGLSMLGLWDDTSIESFCLPGRVALQAMLQDVFLVRKEGNANYDEDDEEDTREEIRTKERNLLVIRDIGHLLDAAYEITKNR